MPNRLIPTFSPAPLSRALRSATFKLSSPPPRSPSSASTWLRSLASIPPSTADSRLLPEAWFTGSQTVRFGQGYSGGGLGGQERDHKPPDERTLRLGKTLRVLQSRLPTLLQTPLPQEILSPQITLHLFPSTHPHLPTVTGRVAYVAALWTAPVAWGRVPIVGNVRLEILSERMVKQPSLLSDDDDGNHRQPHQNEKLIVRWRTVGKRNSRTRFGTASSGVGSSSSSSADLSPTLPVDGSKDEEFTGLFIFGFDEQGRIASHTIEHVEEDGGRTCEEKTTRFVSVTDWLLGRLGGLAGGPAPPPAVAACVMVDAGAGEEFRRVGCRGRRGSGGSC